MTLVYWPFSRTTRLSRYQRTIILDFYWIKDVGGGGGDNWSGEMCKAAVKSSPQTNIHLSTSWKPFLLPKQQCWSTERAKFVYLNKVNID